MEEKNPFFCSEYLVPVMLAVVSHNDNGVRLQLTVVDTPGFGDNIDNTDW